MTDEDLAGRVKAFDEPSPVLDRESYYERWRDASAAIRAESSSRLDLRYGERPRALLDYFPAGPGAGRALFVFIHGGYWQRNSKEQFAFIAAGPRSHGMDVCVVGYTLAPDASLPQIVAEIRRSLAFLSHHVDELGFDPARVFLGGWSAGAHLTAIVADEPMVRAGLGISGLYDLRPIAQSRLNEKLSLDGSDVATLSPLNHVAGLTKPLRLFVGEEEIPELKRQSLDYASSAQRLGVPVSLTRIPRRHHFSILDEFTRDGVLTTALLSQADSSGAAHR